MPLRPFVKILFDKVVLGQLGGMPEEVRDCLKVAFDNIRKRKLYLDSPRSRNYPFVARACQHYIFVSVNTDKNIAVVVGLLADAGQDLF